jgi:catechol 2,3-dioxygenase-like lactoylglutathione lyase family enzyme
MSLAPKTAGIHHLALRSTDLARSRRFYSELLGFPVVLEGENLFLFAAGRTVIAVRGPEKDTGRDDRFSPFRVGLDHVALGCAEEPELHRVAAGLAQSGVPNTGVKLDEALRVPYVAFKDPDGIAWELYHSHCQEVEAAEAYVRGLGARDLKGVAFAADVTFESPLTPSKLSGREAVLGFLQGVLPAVRGTRIERSFVSGDDVACRFDLVTAAGVISAFDYFKISGGEIREIRPFFDPRPLLAHGA